jgi:hypothetical protein
MEMRGDYIDDVSKEEAGEVRSRKSRITTRADCGAVVATDILGMRQCIIFIAYSDNSYMELEIQIRRALGSSLYRTYMSHTRTP